MIPKQYADLFTWFNQVTGDLSKTNSDFLVLQKYTSDFKQDAKTAISVDQTSAITDAVIKQIRDGIDQLEEIIKEIIL
jgi:hypothetical protein